MDGLSRYHMDMQSVKPKFNIQTSEDQISKVSLLWVYMSVLSVIVNVSNNKQPSYREFLDWQK